MRESLDQLQPLLDYDMRNSQGKLFASYLSLLRVVLCHARMAFLASDSPRERQRLLGKDAVQYEREVGEAILLQSDLVTKFMATAD